MIKITVRKKKIKKNLSQLKLKENWNGFIHGTELLLLATFTQEQFEQSYSRYFVSLHFTLGENECSCIPTQNLLRLDFVNLYLHFTPLYYLFPHIILIRLKLLTFFQNCKTLFIHFKHCFYILYNFAFTLCTWIFCFQSLKFVSALLHTFVNTPFNTQIVCFKSWNLISTI